MKRVIQVFRIEHPSDCKGLWHSRGDDGYSRIFQHSMQATIRGRHSNCNMFPPLHADWELVASLGAAACDPYKFAFNTIERFKIAFTNEEVKEAVEKLGFRVYLYEVNDYHQSRFQTIFKNPINKTDITSLFLS